MRGTLGTAAARLLLAGLMAGLINTTIGLEARALGGLNTITLSPTHGKAAATFAVTYAISPCVSAGGLTIGFSWNALPPAGQLLGTATTDGNCRATLSTTSPSNPATHAGPAPGNYQVFGYLALPTGGATPGTEVSTTYTVDVSATPTPAPTAKPTAKATSQASSPATSAPTASASSAAGATASPSVVAETSQAGRPRAASPTRASSRSGWWTLGWLVISGAMLLFAFLLALLATWIIRRRRAQAAGLQDDKAA